MTESTSNDALHHNQPADDDTSSTSADTASATTTTPSPDVHTSSEATDTASATKPPFQSFSFTMTDAAIGRRVFRMRYQPESNDYALHVEAGTTANPTEKFDRTVGRSSAEGLFEVLLGIDAFNWESEYGDTLAPGTRRWNVNIVLQEDVFSVASLGGSSVPDGFDDLLEALYQRDLPRPAAPQTPPLGAGDAPGMPDLRALFGMGGAGAPDSFAMQQMQEAFAQMQSNPAAFTNQMKEEFRHLPYDQQNALIDLLSSSGMGTREWWERFFRG